MLVERSVLKPSLAQPSGTVDTRVPRHVRFAMLLEQLFFALRLDGLPVDLQGRGVAGFKGAANTDSDVKAGPG